MKWVFSFAPLFLFGLYMNNPATPELSEEGLLSSNAAIAPRVSYETNHVFNRPMKIEFDRFHENTKLERFSYDANLGFAHLNFFDVVEIYGGLGQAGFSIKRNPFPATHIDYKTPSSFGWSVGGAGTLFYIGNFSCGFNANYFSSTASCNSVIFNGNAVNPAGARIESNEWQVGVGMSYLYEFIVPYLGVAFTAGQLKVRNPSSLAHLSLQREEIYKKDQVTAVIVGLGLSHETFWQLNVEGRFLGETAVSFSAAIRI